MSPKEFAAAQQKINQVIEIVLGTDPEQPLSRTGVDKDAFRVAEQIRPAILERVRSGEVKHLSWEKFSATLTAQRKGREGKVDGGVRLSGGMVVVSARDMRKFDGDIGAISIAAIKQAGELADAAKKQRKQDPGARQDIPVEHVQSYVERPPVLNHARSIWAQAVPL